MELTRAELEERASRPWPAIAGDVAVLREALVHDLQIGQAFRVIFDMLSLDRAGLASWYASALLKESPGYENCFCEVSQKLDLVRGSLDARLTMIDVLNERLIIASAILETAEWRFAVPPEPPPPAPPKLTGTTEKTTTVTAWDPKGRIKEFDTVEKHYDAT